MLITKCPHVHRKHYAKVSRICLNISEHVLKLLQKVRKESKCMELLPHWQITLLNGDVPNLLSLWLSQGKSNFSELSRENAATRDSLGRMCQLISQMLWSKLLIKKTSNEQDSESESHELQTSNPLYNLTVYMFKDL